ncbi:MAG: hypothetical protein CBC91_03770 [Rickettsiales bacterium TMED131]|nr:MAG: hypothetical protein CBC91_03770 [Rickettsiales bacterium TMED131]
MKLREITESTVITENPITAQKAAGAVKQAATPPAGEPTSSGAKIDLKKQSKTAQGSKMAANAMGAKGGSGAMMAKGLDKLASGGAMTGALSKQIAPFAKQLTAILGNQQLRQKFMMLVKQAETGAKKQAPDMARGQPPQAGAKKQEPDMARGQPPQAGAKEGMDLKDKEDYKAKKKALQDIQMDPHTHKDEKLKKELMRKKSDLDSSAKEKGYKEDTEVDAIKQLAGIVSKANTPQTAYSEELKKLAGINEFATAGATSAGNIASVANPAQAKGKRPTDSKGLPKAPQKKKANGTAENALDIKDNFFGGATVKR